MKAPAGLMRCPRCANPLLLADIYLTVAVRPDWTGQPFGRIQIPADAALRCNRFGCEWTGVSRDFDKTPASA